MGMSVGWCAQQLLYLAVSRNGCFFCHKFRKLGQSLEILLNFDECIEVELLNETPHAPGWKSAQRSCPGQHFLFEEVFVDSNGFSTLTPPKGHKLVAFHHFPKLFWKWDRWEIVGFTHTLVRNRRDSFGLTLITARSVILLFLYWLYGSIPRCSFLLSWRVRRNYVCWLKYCHVNACLTKKYKLSSWLLEHLAHVEVLGQTKWN